jgi:hypothetical protein
MPVKDADKYNGAHFIIFPKDAPKDNPEKRLIYEGKSYILFAVDILSSFWNGQTELVYALTEDSVRSEMYRRFANVTHAPYTRVRRALKSDVYAFCTDHSTITIV